MLQIQLTAQQLQMIKMQLQGNSSQPVIIQTAPIATGTQAQLIQVKQVKFSKNCSFSSLLLYR